MFTALSKLRCRYDSGPGRPSAALALLCIAALLMIGGCTARAAGETAPTVPEYELDTSWPQLPLPNNWALGLVSGIFIDARNHVWMVQDPTHFPAAVGGASASPVTGCCVPAPPVIQFDAAGKVLRSWGGPGQGYDWPTFPHGVYVDHQDNVWIAGASTRVGANGEPPDGMVLKFDANGRFLLQIGERGPSRGNLDTTQLGGPAAVAVDPLANEVYIADGYANARVIVFDADTGEFKRQWGAYGEPPTDAPAQPATQGAAASRQFSLVHCVRIANDGLVYVCDRRNNRLQVFRKDGTFVREHVYEPATRGAGSVGNVSFWPNEQQTFLLMNDPGNVQWVLARRSDGAVLSRFGRFGQYAGEFQRTHQMEFDRQGAIYTSEAARVQKFRIVNGVQP